MQLVGGIYGYGLIQCIGVASGCCCKEVYIDILTIIINFPYSTCISSFWQQHPYFFVHFKNVFSFLFMLFFTTYSKR